MDKCVNDICPLVFLDTFANSCFAAEIILRFCVFELVYGYNNTVQQMLYLGINNPECLVIVRVNWRILNFTGIIYMYRNLLKS